MLKKIKKLNKQNGFVMLFSIVLASIILSVTLGLTNISLKELNFNTSAKDSNDAFFAADTGAECALYYDLIGTQSFFGIVNPIGQPGTTVSTYCAGTSINLNNGSTIPDPVGPWTFYVYPLGENGKACAVVTVSKTTNPDTTSIVSLGYNTGGDTSSDCTSSVPNRVERRIELNY
jgi:hypothetical protein